MRQVTSRGVEVFYRHNGDPIEVYPRFCVDEGAIKQSCAPCLKSGNPLGEQMKRKPDSSVCFWRTYALGDLLLLTPIINWLKDEYPACTLYLATAEKFLDLFRYWNAISVVPTHKVLNLDYDVGYYLDTVLEGDHTGGPKSYKHRVDLYCEFLGIPVPKDPLFSLPYGERELEFAVKVLNEVKGLRKAVIAMQVFGSTPVKRLPLTKVKRIIEKLSLHYSVIAVHNARVDLGYSSALNMTGKTTIYELAALIDCVDAVVTMDSGILWVAHCTKTPVVTLLGPTRAEERMGYHRNYHAVNLAKMVNCEPCFERMANCNGKIRCMNEPDEDEIIKEIEIGIRKLIYS